MLDQEQLTEDTIQPSIAPVVEVILSDSPGAGLCAGNTLLWRSSHFPGPAGDSSGASCALFLKVIQGNPKTRESLRVVVWWPIARMNHFSPRPASTASSDSSFTWSWDRRRQGHEDRGFYSDPTGISKDQYSVDREIERN